MSVLIFGCFSYAVRAGRVIRPHFVANDVPGCRPLGAERISARRELGEMPIAPVPFAQPVADYIAAFHARNGLAYRRHKLRFCPVSSAIG
jgi:hypothetical protein